MIFDCIFDCIFSKVLETDQSAIWTEADRPELEWDARYGSSREAALGALKALDRARYARRPRADLALKETDCG